MKDALKDLWDDRAVVRVDLITSVFLTGNIIGVFEDGSIVILNKRGDKSYIPYHAILVVKKIDD